MNKRIKKFSKYGYTMEIKETKLLGLNINVYIDSDQIAIYPTIKVNPINKQLYAEFDSSIMLEPDNVDLWHNGIDSAIEFIKEAELVIHEYLIQKKQNRIREEEHTRN